MNGIQLPGLNGSQLLGFVSALGVLEALSATHKKNSDPPRLGWCKSAGFVPYVTGAESIDDVILRVLEDATSSEMQWVFSLNYLKYEKKGPRSFAGLRPQVHEFREWLESAIRERRHRTAEFLGSLMCETATELSKQKDEKEEDLGDAESTRAAASSAPIARVQPTPFDFTSRNTQFLDQIRRIRDVLTSEMILHDLTLGRGNECERIMRWDTLADLPGAQFAGVRAKPRPVAEWLFFRGIHAFPLSGTTYASMAGFTGRRKAGRLNWILWEGGLSMDVVRGVLTNSLLLSSVEARLATGCIGSFAVELTTDATGYDGSVSPSASA